jgi:ribonuclease III
MSVADHDVAERIESAIGHRFAEPALLWEALTHTSFAAEHAGTSSYERMEFLGDAVLELVTTSLIFEAMVDDPEGVMTKVRASIVDEPTLAHVARSWHLDLGLRLGVGEERSGGRARDSILSDAAEAVIAAVYLDAGFEQAAEVVESAWVDLIDDRLGRETVADGRSALQEALAKRGLEVTFSYEREGPDHAVTYTATAAVGGRTIGVGSGGSKKSAAIAAANDAIDRGE